MILRHFGGRKAQPLIPLVVVMTMLWRPFYYDLYHGQIMMLTLWIITVAWFCLRGGRDIEGGAMLGTLLALKLYAWPILVLLVARRRFRALLSTLTVFLSLNIAMMFWVGENTVLNYYLHIGPKIALIYRSHPLNFSAFAIAADLVGPWFGVVLTLIFLMSALFLTLKSQDFDHAFMIMLVCSVVVSPVAWLHYFVTLLPAFCLVASWQSFSIGERALLGLIIYASVPEIYESLLPESIMRAMPLVFTALVILLLSRQLTNRRQSSNYRTTAGQISLAANDDCESARH
jgi:hypothetical protein